MKVELIFISEEKAKKWGIELRALTLPYLAALTPSEFEVKITNTKYENINLETDADLIQTH